MSKLLIAEAAARILHEQCLQDYGLAKRKALESLGLSAQTALPENQLINQALKAHLALFANQQDRDWALQLQRAAIEACALFKDFPVYVGGSLAFAAAKLEDRLELHIYDDSPEPVLWLLQEHSIPYREQERVLRISRLQEQSFPCFSFVANEVPVSITLFPDTRPRPQPRDIDGSALPRLKASQLARL